MHDIEWLQAHGQRLGLLPRAGGGVAAWQTLQGQEALDLWRPWDGCNDDRYTLSSFAMLPWSNRISHGGFEHAGQFHPMRPNRGGEAYPIHGDGWLQPWRLERIDAAHAVMRLSSQRFGDAPYEYDAQQHFELVEGGLDQTVSVTHRGDGSLPYGLGLHPWFPRTPRTTLHAQVRGVWLCGSDPIPTRHTADIPDSWDLRRPASMNGDLIDNAYTGWNGEARIEWPERGYALRMQTLPIETPQGPVAPVYCLVYRPPGGASFCFEPITQPIDAFHLEGRPGLVTLERGQSLRMSVRWRIEKLS